MKTHGKSIRNHNTTELKDRLAEKTEHAHRKAMPDHQKKGHHPHKDHHGHDGMEHDHHRMMIADFRQRFWVSLVLTVPILVFSPMIQDLLRLRMVTSR